MTLTTKIGCGQDVSGEAVVVGNDNKVLGSRDLTMDFSGKILIVATPASKEFLEKARFVGVSGVILPAMHFRDFEYFQGLGDMGIMVLGRFGTDLGDHETLDKALKLHGKVVKLHGSGKILDNS